MLAIFLIIPLLSSFLIVLLGRVKNWLSDILANLAGILLVGISFYALYILNLSDGSMLTYKVGGWLPPYGILLVADHLTLVMLITVNIISFVSLIFSISYMEKYTDKYKYYSLFMLMVAGMNGFIISGDIFNMYVFLEISSIASYALVAFGVQSEELEATFRYIVLGTVASGLILLGIVLLYGLFSTLNLADLSVRINKLNSKNLLELVSILFLVGFGLKAALVPFHSWLPDAHPSAPAPISAMLSGVLIKTLGIYGLLRILINVIDVNSRFYNGMLVLGIISMIVGVILALYQWDYKRLLAYHSISQVGYIFLGIGLNTQLGLLGGLLHLMNHSVFKSLLFLTSGSVDYAIGTRDLRKMGGLSEKMPVTTFSSLIASLSIAGIPPFNGFWSKLLIVIACLQKGSVLSAFLAVLVSVLTLASFTKVLKYGFYQKVDGDQNNFKSINEVPFYMKAAMIILVFLCVFMGLLLLPKVKDALIGPSVSNLFMSDEYAKKVFIKL